MKKSFFVVVFHSYFCSKRCDQRTTNCYYANGFPRCLSTLHSKFRIFFSSHFFLYFLVIAFYPPLCAVAFSGFCRFCRIAWIACLCVFDMTNSWGRNIDFEQIFLGHTSGRTIVWNSLETCTTQCALSEWVGCTRMVLHAIGIWNFFFDFFFLFAFISPMSSSPIWTQKRDEKNE